MDAKESEDHRYDFYELGLGEPYTISAEQSRGIGDLLDATVASFPKVEEDDFRDEIKVAFIGKPNAGKSSLVNRILGRNAPSLRTFPVRLGTPFTPFSNTKTRITCSSTRRAFESAKINEKWNATPWCAL